MIRFADQKAGAVLVVYGFLITIYIEIGKNLVLTLSNLTILGIFIFIIGLVSGLLILNEVMCLFVKVIRPRLANGYNANEKCIYYFEHVANCSRSEIVESIISIDEVKMVSEIATQIHENSKILVSKLSAIRSVINRLIVAGILVAAFGLATKILQSIG